MEDFKNWVVNHKNYPTLQAAERKVYHIKSQITSRGSLIAVKRKAVETAIARKPTPSEFEVRATYATLQMHIDEITKLMENLTDRSEEVKLIIFDICELNFPPNLQEGMEMKVIYE